MMLRFVGFLLYVVLIFGAAPLWFEIQQWRRSK